ncbi:nuclear transport factor 2 family protein (plasmid) [Streptomyces sp. NBC_01471]|uniref:nuclear transport factor 2 family protein n=1 Tax=Streptomyces sp. NBC_01471 TaxID=2903879 RepID=UPI002F90F3AB
MTKSNEQAIRDAYQIAEEQDIRKWVSLFTEDGTFTDVSAGRTYSGSTELGTVVEIYAKAFPDMHRELYDIYVSGDVVVVELSLNGTHEGPLELPSATIPPTGKVMKTPCCDVFRLENGKIKSFHCYTAATVLLSQLGVM